VKYKTLRKIDRTKGILDQVYHHLISQSKGGSKCTPEYYKELASKVQCLSDTIDNLLNE